MCRRWRFRASRPCRSMSRRSFSRAQVQFNIVGLGDKAVAESRERVRAALYAIGLALPGKRLAVNLSPADLPKEGSHYDLPIALAVLAALGVMPQDFLNRYMRDRRAGARRLDLRAWPARCPRRSPPMPRASASSAPRPAGRKRPGPAMTSISWRPQTIIQILNHVKGTQVLSRPQPGIAEDTADAPRSQGHQGPGSGEARARSGGGRRPSSADGRAAGRRQVDAGAAPALDPAAHGCARDARCQHDRLARRRTCRTASCRGAARSARRIIRRACRLWSAAACAPSPARWRLPITACSFSTSCRNSSRACSNACASRSRPARPRWRAPIIT